MSDGEFGDERYDSDMEEELNLPRGLKGLLSEAEKKELFTFKRTHNKVQFEERLTELQEAAQKKQDFEALKRLKGPDVAKDKTSAGKKTAAPPAKKQALAAAKKVPAPSSDSDDDSFGSDMGSDASLDDLFDEDELNKISNISKGAADNSDEDEEDEEDVDSDVDNKKKKGRAKAKAKPKAKKSAASKKTGSKRKSYSSASEEEDDDGSDGIMDSDSDNEGRNKKSTSAKKTSKLNKVSKAKASKDDDDYADGDYSDASDGSGDNHNSMKEGGSYSKKSAPSSLLPLGGEKSPPAELEDYMKICMRRHHLAKWLFEPYFKNLMPGLFVRVSVGTHPKTNQNIYRLAEICEVEMNAKAYKLNELKMQINVRLIVMIGKKRHPQAIRFDKISNSRLDNTELQIYFKNLKEQRINEDSFLTKAEALARRQKFNTTVTKYNYTDEEIQQMVEKKKGGDMSHIYTLSGTLDKLKKQLQVAREAQEWDTVDSVQKEIKKNEAKIDLMRSKYDSFAARTDLINARSLERNRIKDANSMAVKMQKAKGDDKDNPYLKRETIAHNIWYTGKKEEEEKKKEKKEEEKASASDLIAEKNRLRFAKLQNATAKYVGRTNSTSVNSAIASGEGDIGYREYDMDKIFQNVQMNLGLKVELSEYLHKSKRQRYLDSTLGDSQNREQQQQIRRGLSMKEYHDFVSKYGNQ